MAANAGSPTFLVGTGRSTIRSPPQVHRAAAHGSTPMTFHTKPPQADGLYDPRYEHDACGVAMIARLDNEPSHDVVDKALTALDNLEHRGAEGADTKAGDGAGILTQLPDAFFRGVVGEQPLAEPGGAAGEHAREL